MIFVPPPRRLMVRECNKGRHPPVLPHAVGQCGLPGDWQSPPTGMIAVENEAEHDAPMKWTQAPVPCRPQPTPDILPLPIT